MVNSNEPSGSAFESTRDAVPEKIQRYRVKSRIGGGGFGTVYLAEDEGLQRQVAIKIPKRVFEDEEARQRFLVEIRTAAKLHTAHPLIVPIYDHGELDDGRPYVVMQYIEGQPLDRLLRGTGVSIRDAVSIAEKLADALHQAHLLGFVHRDVKPANIIIGARGQPFLTDFGLAIHEDEQSLRSGDSSGTLPYRSPEQVRGEAHWMDARCDIWALGVVLYEMITGKRPFTGKNISEMNDQILRRPPKSPRTLNDRIPVALQTICLKCLKKNSEDRFTAADELAACLRQVLAGIPRERLADSLSSAEARGYEAASSDGAGLATKYYISFSQGVAQEEQLAHHLHQCLIEEGNECLLDSGMPTGAAWIDEINRRIRWCDCFVGLFSRNGRHNEMLQTKVRVAHHLQQQYGRPRLLPVRMNNAGPLEYELELYVGAAEWLHWSGTDDSAALAARILETMEGNRLDETGSFHPPAAAPPDAVPASPESDSRPQPSRDPRSAVIPGGTIRATDRHYVSRPEDDVVVQCATLNDVTLVIKGPRQIGKSSLLLHYLSECQRAGKRICFIDFSVFSAEEMSDYRTLLVRLAAAMARRLGLDAALAAEVDSQFSMTQFVESRILVASMGPVVIALDEADRVFGQKYQADFFSMLRMWHNNRSSFLSPQWETMHLAMAISTEPYLLIADGDRSPFNVGLIVDLLPFSLDACQELNSRFEQPMTREQVAALYELLRGHPYLTRLAYYRLAGPMRVTFDELLSHAADERGPFGDHLRAIHFRLHQHPELLAAMKQVIQTGRVADHDLYYRLYGAGLLQRTGEQIKPANLLYDRYFRGIV